MPLFKCSKCGCIEHTALCNFWYQKYHKKVKPMCSYCELGTWHNQFERKSPEEWGLIEKEDGFYEYTEEIIKNVI